MKTAREPHPELIRSVVQQTVARLREQGPVRLVVGLPFYNEADTLPPLVRWLDARLCGAGRKEDTVLVAVGDPAGAACLHALRELPGDCRRQQLLLPGDAGGRGSSVRVLLSLARRLNADLVVLPADIAASDVEGEEPFPLRLAQAVEEGCDLALADRTRSGRVELVGGLLLHPLLESLYGCRLNDGRSMMFAVQRSLVGRLATEAEAWGEEIDGFGIDAWLLTRCLRWRRRVGEVEVAVPSEVGSLEKVAFVMRQVAAALFECIRRDDGSWWEDPHRVEVPVRWTSRAPASAGWGFAAVRVPEMMAHGVRRLHAYRPLLEATLQADVLAALQRAAARPAEPDFGPQAWRQAVEDLLLAFCFRPQWNREDILEALTAAFLFRAADCLERVRRRREAYMAAADAERPWQAQEEWAQVFHEQSQAFVAAGSEFRHRWRLVAAEAAPPITPLYALEFVPGVPVVLPDVLGNRRNRQVRAREVLQGVLKRWQQQFSRFVHLELGVPWSASGREIAERVGALMRELEGTLRELVPGDVHTPEGCRQVAEAWLALLPSRPVLALREEVLREMLARFPPALPSLQHGPGAGGTLHRPLDARDLVCLARLAEETAGISRGIACALEDLRLEAMEFTPLRPLMLADIPEAGGIRLAGVSEWDGLAARLAIAPMSKAMGAAFPTLRFCLSLCYHVETAAGYSDMWAHFAADHRSMGRRIARSLESGASPAPFAAREVLESLHHRRVAAALSALAQVLEGTEHHRVAGLVRIAAAGYGLGMGAGDGVFVPCSVWTWAGYAHAGHPGLPTPLASVVERGAFNLAVLEGICQAMGFEQEDLTVLAWDMIGDGHGDESLLERWLGLAPAPVEAVVQAEPSGYPQAGRLRRVGSGPLLGPVAGHPWENRYVLNPGARHPG
ncbi:MAG: hypothetical protein NUV35_00790 [Syntrophomonadaceae bacterium]|nr:hypothetical protein [Syntrophomonadaceae bacterium]